MIKILLFYFLFITTACLTAREGSTIKYEPRLDMRYYKDYNVDTNTDTDLSVDFSKNTNK